MDVRSESFSICSTFEDDGVCHVEEGSATKDEEPPLVAGSNQSTDKASDDHDLVHGDGVQEGRPRQAAREEQIHEEQGRGEKPVDIPNIEDLANKTANLWTRASKFDRDGRPAEIATQGEVGNGGEEVDQSAQIEEDALLAMFGERPANTTKGRSGLTMLAGNKMSSDMRRTHDRTNRIEEVATTNGDVVVDSAGVVSIAVDIHGVITHVDSFVALMRWDSVMDE